MKQKSYTVGSDLTEDDVEVASDSVSDVEGAAEAGGDSEGE